METRRPLTLPCRAAGRLAFLILLGLTLLGPGGCTLFRRPAAPALPAGFMARADTAGLRNPATRQAAYKALFPQIETLQAGGTISATSTLRRGKDVFDFSYLARNDADAFEHLLRMRGGRGPNTGFDIIVRGRFATVVDYMNKLVFQGNIPAAGSPLAERFGVEPWDLVPIFTIGQRIATGEFNPKVKRRETILRPVDQGGTLKEVVLDNASGLPREAAWEMGGKTYEIHYLGWDFFPDSQHEGEVRLMPSQIKIRRRGLTLNLKLDRYQYGLQFTEKMLTPIIDQDFRMFPLEELKQIF